MVACDGLYADVTDDFLQQKTTTLQEKMIEGVYFPVVMQLYLKIYSPGIRILAGGSFGLTSAHRLNLDQLFSGSAEKNENGLESLREQYKSYKENFVKYMKFDPESPNPC